MNHRIVDPYENKNLQSRNQTTAARAENWSQVTEQVKTLFK